MINKHVPVMLEELIGVMDIKPDGVYVDCTFGSGGHSLGILQSLNSSGKLIAFDCDCATDQWRNEINDPRFLFISDNFSRLSFWLKKIKIEKVDGFLFDLGLSSMQLEMERGFSYRQSNSFLDMRVDKSIDLTAEKIINSFSESNIANIFYNYGEEKKSYKIESANWRYKKKKRISTSGELVKIIISIIGKKKNKQHPAKKAFQALRIFVNNELENLKNALSSTFNFLSKDGRVVVISYHSLEDRIVKNFFKEKALNSDFIISKKPIVPCEDEVVANRKARSAKMRFIKKLF